MRLRPTKKELKEVSGLHLVFETLHWIMQNGNKTCHPLLMLSILSSPLLIYLRG
jgi:hypothetical protein